MEQTALQDHTGLVTRLDGSFATVRFTRGKMCAHCGACLAAGEREMETRVANTLGARVGDTVAIAISPKKVMRASLVAYCIPLLFLLAGVGLGQLISDLWSGILGVLLCACSFVLLRLIEPRFKRKRTFEPRMTAIVAAGDEASAGKGV